MGASCWNTKNIQVRNKRLTKTGTSYTEINYDIIFTLINEAQEKRKKNSICFDKSDIEKRRNLLLMAPNHGILGVLDKIFQFFNVDDLIKWAQVWKLFLYVSSFDYSYSPEEISESIRSRISNPRKMKGNLGTSSNDSNIESLLNQLKKSSSKSKKLLSTNNDQSKYLSTPNSSAFNESTGINRIFEKSPRCNNERMKSFKKIIDCLDNACDKK